jgi:hypothetical protein
MVEKKKGRLSKLCSSFCFLRRREVGFLHKDVKSWFEMGTTNKIATTSSYLSCSNGFQNKQTKEQLQNKFQQTPIKSIHNHKIWQTFTNLETPETNQIHKCTKQKEKKKKKHHIEHCWIAAPHKIHNKNNDLPSSFVQPDSSQTLA